MRYYSIKEAYLKNVENVLNNGHRVRDERGQWCLELLNVHSTIQFPFQTNVVSDVNGSIWNGGKLEEYQSQLLNPNPQGFVYTYGERLCGFDTNQIETIIDRLRSCKESRRATAVTLRPAVDCLRDEIPCLIALDFKIRNNLMTVTGLWRSHDYFGAFYPNLQGIWRVAEYVCQYVGDVKIDKFEIHSCSAHIYEGDVASAKILLERNR